MQNQTFLFATEPSWLNQQTSQPAKLFSKRFCCIYNQLNGKIALVLHSIYSRVRNSRDSILLLLLLLFLIHFVCAVGVNASDTTLLYAHAVFDKSIFIIMDLMALHTNILCRKNEPFRSSFLTLNKIDSLAIFANAAVTTRKNCCD